MLLINLVSPDGQTTQQRSGASQDELCLLEMVEDKGIAKLLARDATTMTIEVMGMTEKYDIVKVVEFTSERKMMSVVVRDQRSQDLFVLSKGASDSMLTRLSNTISDQDATKKDL